LGDSKKPLTVQINLICTVMYTAVPARGPSYTRLSKLSAGSVRALIAEKTGFGNAPEEAKMVGEPSCKHL
jgi:hypothetical protein